MGKTKHNKRKYKGKNPTGLPSVKDIVKQELEENDNSTKRDNALQALIEQLQGSSEDKLLALHSLASIFANDGTVEDVVNHQVVRVAAPLLVDESSAVRNAAAGAIRNLSALGDHACDLLVEQDIMTPLTALIHKYAEEFQSYNKATPALMGESADTFIQSVHLLWNLCASNNTALKYFNERNLLFILAKCLDCNLFGVEATLVVVQCLQTVTEDNKDVVSQLQNLEQQLQGLLVIESNEPPFLHLKTASSGLLLNIHYGQVNELGPVIMTHIMKILDETLSVDQRIVLNKLTSNLPIDFVTDKRTETDVEEKMLTNTQHLLDAQKLSLEILTNLCACDDDDEDEMEQDSSDTSDEFFNESSSAQEDCIGFEKYSPCLPVEVHEGIVTHGLFQKTWDKTLLPAENVNQILKEHPEGSLIYKQSCNLQCHAFMCLNNLLMKLDPLDVGGVENIYQMWVKIGTFIFKQADPNDDNLLQAATAAMRAAIKKLAELNFHAEGHLEEADLQVMFDGTFQCKNSSVQANIIQTIGTLGVMLVPTPKIHFLKNIGKFLLEICIKENELWIIAEALDAIMDVFSEDNTDEQASAIFLVDKLKGFLPVVKSKYRQQRRSLGEHHVLVSTVSINLNRFIKYKEERIGKH